MLLQTNMQNQEFLSLLDNMSSNENIKGLLILACDGNGFTPDSVDDALQNVSVPLFGGIFPAIIHGREKMIKGTIVAGLSKKPDVFTVPDLSDKNLDNYETIENFVPESEDGRTMFVFVDGYSKMLSSLIESLYNIFGLQYNYIGGGAGSINPAALNMSNSPCIFSNNGLLEDSAILALVDIESAVGVKHGFHELSGPYKVTESSGNAIESLDWKPAFETYKDIIKKHSGKTITSENFFEIGKCFPFGITRLGSELIVRDPFTVEGESLIVATEVPQESFVYILSGNTDSIINAARESYATAEDAFSRRRERTTFIVDCISRSLFLGDDFAKEIEAVCQENVPLIGALALGEIANSGKDYMELFNKTCVVGIIGD